MVFPLIARVITFVFLSSTMATAASLSKPGCQEKCGNLTIPYPFGIGSDCSANSSFTVNCTGNPSTAYMSNINLEVINISIYGVVIVNLPVFPVNCYEGQRREAIPASLTESPFTVSAQYNALTVLGCKNSVWLRANETAAGGCMPMCDANTTDFSCNGVNCCQISIPRRAQQFEFTYESIQANNSTFCGYVFPVDKVWLDNEDYTAYKGIVSDMQNPFDQEFRFVPLVLEWEFGSGESISNGDCEYPSLLDESEYNLTSSSRFCFCNSGYEGNPYLVEGCEVIDECSDPSLNNYDCINGNRKENHKITFPVIIRKTSLVVGIFLGVLIFVAAALRLGEAITEAINAIKASRKHMFFKRNGGVLLEQKLAAIENGIEKTRLFSSVELAKATDDYNENRVLGRGGEGVVYKGILEDGRIVAVKKSERVNQGDDVEGFINEVVIVSQINHRNVVKLLGCCLESEVPHLVYEFVSNGTLFSHIHHPHEDFPLFWEMRVRIAKEVAGALAYLHSAASNPIYHRDIKSTNILLDETKRAKISDFGTSRSVCIDQTHVTTRVVGTFGYLDPEYFQSSQFTEKSDVYSFGVVLVELLTGEKAVSAVRVEEGRGLAMHFLLSMEENNVFDIIDARVLREGRREEIEAMAEIARRCLHLNGKSRPTMKEVSRHLDGIQVEKKVTDPDCDDFSSISESFDLDMIFVET
ncbi:wall-associated receptor kinase-like 1 [Salvia splendens]|uniref:wall-associated receptor kinase-like 1 n=1 Tax=Salvia splendens TaxID=180675 RepID=UPI001C25AB22|nr:wall-associated receptor kinase-like 1 [Salvia splendens]